MRQINAYANWLHDFVNNPWALFDTIVVTLSVLSLGPFQTVIPVSALRFFRVIRFLLVLKILGKASSLKRIVAALGNAIFPMLNAFMIVIMVLSMCESSAHSQTRRRPGRHKPGTTLVCRWRSGYGSRQRPRRPLTLVRQRGSRL